jgi:hypothetical protein
VPRQGLGRPDPAFDVWSGIYDLHALQGTAGFREAIVSARRDVNAENLRSMNEWPAMSRTQTSRSFAPHKTPTRASLHQHDRGRRPRDGLLRRRVDRPPRHRRESETLRRHRTRQALYAEVFVLDGSRSEHLRAVASGQDGVRAAHRGTVEFWVAPRRPISRETRPPPRTLHPPLVHAAISGVAIAAACDLPALVGGRRGSRVGPMD